MSNSKLTTVTTALPSTPDGYDYSLAHSFDTPQTADRHTLKHPSSRLYETIALAHDAWNCDIDEPSKETSLAHSFDWGWRRHSIARNSPDYLGISPDFPGWRPRRSSHEDRRGAIPVTPSEVNTLLPYIPPMDMSSPPSQEWLDAHAKQILAASHADLGSQDGSYSTEFLDNGITTASSQSKAQTFIELHFDYDNGNSFGARTITSGIAHRHSIPRSLSASKFNSDTDTEMDPDIDEESDDGYNWSTTRICEASPHALSDIPRWIIPRKRPSVVISDNGDTHSDNDDEDDDDDHYHLPIGYSPPSSRSSTPTERGSLPPSSDDEYNDLTSKRQRGEALTPTRAVKKPKRYSADTPARHVTPVDVDHASDSEEDRNSSGRASSLPRTSSSFVKSSSPPLISSSSLHPISPSQIESQRTPHRSTAIRTLPCPKSAPKSYPCFLDGCTQVCASAGDLQRHQLSLRHRLPSCVCLACGKTYTRPDALKRHLNTKAACKREHTSKLTAQGAGTE